MTPKEKAEEILNKFNLPTGLMSVEIKQCALIAIDEIINCDSFFKTLEGAKEFTKFWNAVQKEINLL